jgi:hypothetical protein
LLNDINALGTIDWNDGKGWSPIGTNSTRFQGTFDGQNYTISGLYIDRQNESYSGLFGVSQNAQFSNLILNDCDITGGQNTGGFLGGGLTTSISNIHVYGVVSTSSFYLGGITSYLNTSSEINDSTNYATIVNGGSSYTGGIVGYLENSSINNVVNYGDITSSWTSVGGIVGIIKNVTLNGATNFGSITTNPTASRVGGIVGEAQQGGTPPFNPGTTIITDTSNTGTINSGWLVGGIVGLTSVYVSVINATNEGDIVGNSNNVGGITGQLNSSGLLENVINLGNIESTSYYVGGIAGENSYGTIRYAHNSGEVTSSGDDVGGIAGYSNQGYLEQTNNSGNIIGVGNQYTGGVVGLQTGAGVNAKIFNSYNSGNISGNNYVGGITGWINMSRTEKNYNTGEISGNNYVGGITGKNSGKLINSFSTGGVSGVSEYGGLIGENETTAFYYELNGAYWDTILSSQANCYSAGSSDCELPTNNNAPYYYDSDNEPLLSWDFDTIWSERVNNYPILQWQE